MNLNCLAIHPGNYPGCLYFNYEAILDFVVAEDNETLEVFGSFDNWL